MKVLRASAMIGVTSAIAVTVTVVGSAGARTADSLGQTALPRATSFTAAASSQQSPRGALENCLTTRGPGGSLDDFTLSKNLVVGPFALLHAGRTLDYDPGTGGNKVFVLVKGGHRVTLELPRQTRPHVGLAFGKFPTANVTLRGARRVVTFIACRRGESLTPWDEWPVSGWVGALIADSPRCVPLLVWVDNEPSPRRTIVRFGVRACR